MKKIGAYGGAVNAAQEGRVHCADEPLLVETAGGFCQPNCED